MTTSKGTLSTVETPVLHLVLRGDKAIGVSPASYDLASLAEIYPAAALRLGLQRDECRFKVLTKSDSPIADDVGAISMECEAPHYPGHRARFVWHFDSSGLPRQVRIPVLVIDGRYIHEQTIRFRDYQTENGFEIPKTIETLNAGEVISTATLSAPTFQASLPGAQFDHFQTGK